MSKQLPAELLLQIARLCVDVFSDQEFWFDLGQTSSLFRTAVEDAIINAQEPRKPLCTKLGVEMSEEEHCKLICDDLESADRYAKIYDYNFHHFDTQQRNVAIFDCDSDSKVVNSKDQVDRIMTEREKKSSSKFGYQTGIVEPNDEFTDSSTTALADIGLPISATLDESTDSKKLMLSFDWRTIWTVKCAPERKLERQCQQIETEGLNEEQEAAKEAHERMINRHRAQYTQRSKRTRETADSDDD